MKNRRLFLPIPVKPSLLSLIFLCAAGMSRAEVKPNPLFASGAVLQRDHEVPVWGTAADGEKVTVEIAGQKMTATAAAGIWRVNLKPMAAGGPFTLKISGENVVTMDDIWIGEVWICSGQSNMQFALKAAANGKQEIPKANEPAIRLFTVPHKTSVLPLTETGGKWVPCTPETAAEFSAVAYFFGRDLHRKLGVPIGLIHSSWGGTPAEAWTSREALDKEPALKSRVKAANENLARQRTATAAYPAKLAEYKIKLRVWNEADGADFQKLEATWKRQTQEARKQGKPVPQRPQPPASRPVPPRSPESGPGTPTVLYNGMIAPLIPYSIRGAIWYQGEANRKNATEYRTLFPTMIADWRTRWDEGNFPFLFVQLAPYIPMGPEIREAQLLTLARSPNTAMAVITDLGDAKNIHPKRKQQVGERLAIAARALAYGEKIEYSGPLYRSMKVESGKVVLSFTHTGSGLVAKGGKLIGFTIAGADKSFVPATAEIHGTEVFVSAPGITEPVAVRYGWTGFPEVNLYNREGLPASPFRTDVE